MNPDDPVITRVSATNPVPDPDALTAEQRAAGEALRATIARTGATPSLRARRIWPGALAFAGIIPVVIVLIFVIGIHHRPSGIPRRGGSSELRLPSSGTAQTLLLVGSDHRAGEPYRSANTDTMLLVRLDPGASTINVLSVPRDLEVRIRAAGGAYTAKLNSAYSVGGPSLLLNILRTQVFPGLEVNHIIDFNFQGFSDLVDALGCVYGDVDHRYINVNDNDAAQTDYSSIDLQAGYQQLCGTQALQFVRFRHTDSDLVRDARQQDFLRWVNDSVSLGDLISKRDRLFQIIGRYAQTDIGLHSTDGLIQLFDLAVNTAGHPFNRIPFPAQLRPCDASAACYLTATPANEAAAYEQFLSTGAVATGPSSRSAPSSASQPPASGHTGTATVVRDVADGQAQATTLGSAGLPVYYPTVIANGSGYCSTATGNCRVAPNPTSRYANSYPRAYKIGAGGHGYPSYRMTLVLNAVLGEYYGVQGTTWSDPPILRHPTQTVMVNGRQLREYGTGSELSLVAFSTPSGTYWVSNTLTDSIPSAELIAIAASMRPAV
jgi:polyisoprenyl-teichoic acid--peptidoglycan teichoic acid transferase